MQNVSEKDIYVDKNTPIENQIAGYDGAQDQYALKSAGEITYVDFSELFRKVSNGEKVLVEGVEGSIPGFSIAYQENDDMFTKEDMFVGHISVTKFKNIPHKIYQSTESPSQYNAIHDNIKDTILNEIIREDEDRMRRKDVWKGRQTYNRSFPCPTVLEHDKFPEEVLANTARIALNVR